MNPEETSFIASVAEAAQSSQALTGVPASITIAQAILESGWGKTQLAQEDFNFFGIKATEGENYAEFPTAEYIHGVKEIVEAKFAKYGSVEESFAAHGKLLSTLPRYAPAMAVKQYPPEFANQLQKCGYSTSPTYSETLVSLINEFNLAVYDRLE